MFSSVCWKPRAASAALRERGYGDEGIDKLWGGNLLRVWAEVERSAEGAGA